LKKGKSVRVCYSIAHKKDKRRGTYWPGKGRERIASLGRRGGGSKKLKGTGGEEKKALKG